MFDGGFHSFLGFGVLWGWGMVIFQFSGLYCVAIMVGMEYLRYIVYGIEYMV